jgi:hypothetical protein
MGPDSDCTGIAAGLRWKRSEFRHHVDEPRSPGHNDPRDRPKIDLGAVTVTVVDCATPHTAEVFFRGPMWVDTTVPDVANRNCGKAFPDYTGQPVDGSPYTMTYLVDADQDRTSENPTAPGTLICLVEGANGRPLTGSARR